MGAKESFTAEEWQTLLQLPMKIGVTLMVVAPSGPIGLTKETMALAKAPFALAQASNANALVSALAVELQAQAKAIVKSEESAFKHSDPMSLQRQDAGSVPGSSGCVEQGLRRRCRGLSDVGAGRGAESSRGG